MECEVGPIRFHLRRVSNQFNEQSTFAHATQKSLTLDHTTAPAPAMQDHIAAGLVTGLNSSRPLAHPELGLPYFPTRTEYEARAEAQAWKVGL